MTPLPKRTPSRPVTWPAHRCGRARHPHPPVAPDIESCRQITERRLWSANSGSSSDGRATELCELRVQLERFTVQVGGLGWSHVTFLEYGTLLFAASPRNCSSHLRPPSPCVVPFHPPTIPSGPPSNVYGSSCHSVLASFRDLFGAHPTLTAHSGG